MPQASSLLDLMRIRAHNRSFLDSINGNLGTALGFKKRTNHAVSSDPAVIVFVRQKIDPKWLPQSQRIPKSLDGPDGLSCPLDVVEGSSAEEEEPVSRDESELSERLRGWDDRIWAGSQISHWVNPDDGRYSLGTLGAFVRRKSDARLGFLTNQHVGVSPGKKIYFPVPWGTRLGTTSRTITHVPDHEWYGPLADEPNTFVRVDCAFVELAAAFPQADIDPRLLGVGQIGEVAEISLNDMTIIGKKVLRVGRTTGLRKGTIAAFGYEFFDGESETRYTDLLIIGEDGVPFSTHGDSGSLIVTDDMNHNPIGLLWGGWESELRTGYGQENWTYGIALSRVMAALDIELVQSL